MYKVREAIFHFSLPSTRPLITSIPSEFGSDITTHDAFGAANVALNAKQLCIAHVQIK